MITTHSRPKSDPPSAGGIAQADDSDPADDQVTFNPALTRSDSHTEHFANRKQQLQQRVSVYDVAEHNGLPDYKDQVVSGQDRRLERASNRATPATTRSSGSSAPQSNNRVHIISIEGSRDPVPFASQIRLVPDEELNPASNKHFNDDDTSRHTIRRRQIGMVLGVLVMALVIVVGIVLGVRDKNDPTPTPLRSPTPFPSQSPTAMLSMCDLAKPVTKNGTRATFGSTMELDTAMIGRVCGKEGSAPVTETRNGAWYQVMGTGGVLNLSTNSDTFPAHMNLYNAGDCNNNLAATDLACEGIYQYQADQGSGTITWLSTAGQLYLIFVHSVDTNPGADFVFYTAEEEEPLTFRVFQDSGYAITNKTYSGDQARDLTPNYHVCGRRAELVVITSQEENDFVDAFASEFVANEDYFLLGGFQTALIPGDTADTFVEGWEWVGDHGTFPFSNFTNTDNRYSNWDDGEPDQREGFGDEDCLTIYTGNGRWHDRNCTDPAFPFRFIVEVELAESRPVLILDCDTGLDTDPLISIQMGEDGQYVCTYLSNAIADLPPEGFGDSLASLLNSPPLIGRLSAEQIESILNCAG